MEHLLKIKCVDLRGNVHILASTSVPFTLTTVQVPNLALTHTKRITVYPFTNIGAKLQVRLHLARLISISCPSLYTKSMNAATVLAGSSMYNVTFPYVIYPFTNIGNKASRTFTSCTVDSNMSAYLIPKCCHCAGWQPVVHRHKHRAHASSAV